MVGPAEHIAQAGRCPRQGNGRLSEAAQENADSGIDKREVRSETPAASPRESEGQVTASAAQDSQAESSDTWELYQPRGARQRVMVGRLAENGQRVERLIRRWLPSELLFWPPMLFAESMAAIVLFRLWQRAIPSVDFRGDWMTFTMTILWFLMFSVIVALGRFIALWWSISGITREFLALPMVLAFDRIPPMYARSFGRYLDRIKPSLLNFEIPVRQWAMVAGGFSKVRPALCTRFHTQSAGPGRRPLDDSDFEKAARAITLGNPCAKDAVPEGSEAVEGVLAIYQDEVARLQTIATGQSDTVGKGPVARTDDDVAWSRTWFGLRNSARACLDVIEPFWADRAAIQGYGDSSQPAKASAEVSQNSRPASIEPEVNSASQPAKASAEVSQNLPPDSVEPEVKASSQSRDVAKWIRDAEDLIALEVIAYVSQTTVQLKILAYYLAVTPVLLLMAVGSYPFQPERFLQVCIWTILFMVVGGVIWVYVRMEKNEFISRVSRTTPNQVTLDRTFVGNLFAFVIPLVGVVLTQFPFFSDSLNQLLEPITRVLK